MTEIFSLDTVFLKRLYVLLYMELESRRVIWFAVTDKPDSTWVTQQARNLAWELAEHRVKAKFLIHDHDAKFGGSDLVFQVEGVTVIKDSNRGAPRLMPTWSGKSAPLGESAWIGF